MEEEIKINIINKLVWIIAPESFSEIKKKRIDLERQNRNTTHVIHETTGPASFNFALLDGLYTFLKKYYDYLIKKNKPPINSVNIFIGGSLKDFSGLCKDLIEAIIDIIAAINFIIPSQIILQFQYDDSNTEIWNYNNIKIILEANPNLGNGKLPTTILVLDGHGSEVTGSYNNPDIFERGTEVFSRFMINNNLGKSAINIYGHTLITYLNTISNCEFIVITRFCFNTIFTRNKEFKEQNTRKNIHFIQTNIPDKIIQNSHITVYLINYLIYELTYSTLSSVITTIRNSGKYLSENQILLSKDIEKIFHSELSDMDGGKNNKYYKKYLKYKLKYIKLSL
jgi:hypothetical protein